MTADYDLVAQAFYDYLGKRGSWIKFKEAYSKYVGTEA